MNDHIHIVPAEPGHRLIYREDDGKLFIDDPVIAWRIETSRSDQEWHSDTFPITVEGDATGNCVGILYPDERVWIFGDCTVDNIMIAERHLRARG